MKDCDFCGWVTKNNIRCTDGLTILQNAFEHNDGCRVPLVWMHDHSDPTNTIGHVDLENREEGVYGYGQFNTSEKAKAARAAVDNGDIVSMSIFAGHVKKNGNYVLHGDIKEVSLVLAGANPGARIENVIRHSDDDDEIECDLYLDMGDGIGFVRHSDNLDDSGDDIEHADEETVEDVLKTFNEKQLNVMEYMIRQALMKAGVSIQHSDEEDEDGDEDDESETVNDVIETMSEKQKKAMNFMIGVAVESAKNNGGNNNMEMQHNVFENEETIYEAAPISHADQEMILANAKKSNVGSFKTALHNYVEEQNTNHQYDSIISHGFQDITQLFPEPHDMMPGAPEAIPEDIAWVNAIMRGVTKSPFAKVKTRQADISAIKAQGYPKKGTKKNDMGDISLVTRVTNPQTVYIKDKLDRDDILDIVDFDVVAYMHGIMRQNLEELIAKAILIGDGLEAGDEDKIREENIHSIWHDDELYTIHELVNIKDMAAKLQGTNTGANFGEEYIRTEAIISSALYSREKYKGRGKPAFFCEPHTVNTMLLARDMNGRRIYNTVSDLTAALNVSAIHTVEEFAGKTRTVEDSGTKTRKLLGIFVNPADYQVGSVRGGQITSFNDFDIDYNQEKFLQEARLSGALTRVKSAIVLEEDITA